MDEEIFETAKSISTCAKEDETLLGTLCTACTEQVKKALRAGLSPADCESAFVCAAAWLAAAALMEAKGGAEELSSLRAGDVTIAMKNGASGGRAAALRRSARLLMAPYTEGGDFFFCGAKG